MIDSLNSDSSGEKKENKLYLYLEKKINFYI